VPARRRTRVATATVVLGLFLGSVLADALPAAAEAAPPNGAFSCVGSEPAPAAVTAVSISPNVVLGDQARIDVRFLATLEAGVRPVVQLANVSGSVSYQADALLDGDGWSAQLDLPADAQTAELGLTLQWVGGIATPCGLRVRGLPWFVALRPVTPARLVTVAAAARDGAARLTWTPGPDGNAPAGYDVVVHPGGQLQRVTDPDARGVTVTGLTNGQPYTFDVVARNAVGASPITTTAAVVPRRTLVLADVVAAPTLVAYGGTSTVRATVRDLSGAPVAGIRVLLQSRRAGATTWSTAASVDSDAHGAILLRTTLKASSDLALAHTTGANVVPRRLLPRVFVASRVSASPASTRVGAAYRTQMTGSVSPAGVVGSAVRLERYTGGTWQRIATGEMVTSTSYRVRWTPARASRYRLRVSRPATTSLVVGRSAVVTVDAVDTRRSVAREILANPRVELATVHGSGIRDLATAMRNMQYTAAGSLVRRSSYGRAPGGWVALDLRVLRLVRTFGRTTDMLVAELAGGSHASRSGHYAGRAVDVTQVAGVRVRRGSGYLSLVRACQAAGATKVYHPSYDPYGGHQNHVHCSFD
jgi:hypothetical protein